MNILFKLVDEKHKLVYTFQRVTKPCEACERCKANRKVFCRRQNRQTAIFLRDKLFEFWADVLPDELTYQAISHRDGAYRDEILEFFARNEIEYLIVPDRKTD